jgi:hypothetical protein
MNDNVQYEFTCTAAPVQAEGTIAGKRFYFRSRHEEWTFSVSENQEIDPVDIISADDAKGKGFFLEGRYGMSAFDASYMPLDIADKIIRECADAYLQTKDV